MKKTGLLKLSLLLVLALTMVLGLAACQKKIESMDVVRGEFPEVFARYGYADVTQLKLNIKFENGESATVGVTNDMVTGFSTATVGEFELTVNFAGHEATLPYKVVPSLNPALVFDSNGGSFIPASVTKYGEPAAEPEKDPYYEGHVFLGWFTEKEGGKEYDFSTVLYEDLTVYAHWDTATYRVNFTLDGKLLMAYVNVPYGNKIEKPADPKLDANCEFLGWFYKDEKVDFDKFVVTGNIEIVAKYQLKFEAFVEKLLADLEKEQADVNFYEKEDRDAVAALYTKAVAAIKAAKTREDAQEAYDGYEADLAAYNTYMDLLEAAFAKYDKANYFEATYESMKELVAGAIANMKAYKDGEQLPEEIYAEALEDLAEYPTKADEEKIVEALKESLIENLDAMISEENEVRYDEKNWKALNDLVNQTKKDLEGIKSMEALEEYLDKLTEKFEAIKEYIAADQLVEVYVAYNTLLQNEYWDEDAAELKAIYDEAMEALREYEKGAPNPETIAKQAIEAMDKVMTKAEDIEMGEAAKEVALRELKAYYGRLTEEHYTVENWKTITNIYTTGIEGIRLAQGTRAVAKAKADAMVNISKIDTIAYTEIMDTLIAAYKELAKEEYWDEDWAEVEYIYGEAVDAIREYVGGAPNPDTIAEQAIVAMQKVLTKAEDIEMGNTMKEGKIRELNMFYNGLNKLYYGQENWATVTHIYTTGIEGIRLAEGTRAVADAYGNAITDMKAVSESAYKADIVRLEEAFNAYVETDYFAEDYATIVEIYEEAATALFEYVGGAPNPETIADQAIAAMDKVMTKAEDIEVGNSQKEAALRELELFYNSLNELDYSIGNWNGINFTYANGVKKINKAKGTRAVAQAKADALDQLASVPKLTEEVVNAIAELKTAFEAYNAEDYFTEDYAAIVKIYSDAYDALRSYESGEPTPATIVEEAKEAMAAVNTKADDIEAGEAMKAEKLADLKAFYESLVEVYYSVENWETINKIYAAGLDGIRVAEGTKAVNAAYDNAVNGMKNVSELAHKELIKELFAAYNSYDANNYAEEDYKTLTNICIEALAALRAYVDGEPTPETILAQAKEAMAKVPTKPAE